ncbi:MAG: hypothetical protein ACK5KT_11740 [Dysgonomonas sp.]
MKPKRLLILLIILLPQHILAQTDIFEAMDSTFNARVRAMDDRYINYTRQMDEDFASYLARSWEKFSMAEVELGRFDDEANFVSISLSPLTKYPTYTPVKGAKYKEVNIPFFEKELSLNVDSDTRFSLSSISEFQVSWAWKKLTATSFSTIIEGTDKLRKELLLNDWGVYMLISQLADQIFAEKQTDEKKVFMAFMLTHAGYNVKLARSGRGTGNEARLHLLIPFKTKVNQWETTIDNKVYYTWTGKEKEKLNATYTSTDDIYSYRKNLKLAKADLNLTIKDVPSIGTVTMQKTIESKSKYLQEVKIAWRSSLTNFYDTYPSTVLPIYANTPLSVATRKSLQLSFDTAINSMSERELVEQLLFWFYHAFQYKLDEEERPLFSEQTVKSLYNDCEDRAVFFARILKEIVGVDVVLVVYEGEKGKISHVATGVHFGEKLNGVSTPHNGKEYMICDPSDKRCVIGSTLDEYRNSKNKIIELIN